MTDIEETQVRRVSNIGLLLHDNEGMSRGFDLGDDGHASRRT